MLRPPAEVLEEVLATPVTKVRHPRAGARTEHDGPDLLMDAAGHTYAVELKKSGRSASVAAAVFQIERYRASLKNGITPLIFVDRMAPNGAALCAEHGIAWIDSDGNAEIALPDLRVRIRGLRRAEPRPNRDGFNAFSRTASRVSHALLLAPGRRWTRFALEQETGLDKGSLSRTIRALSDQRYLNVERQGRASVVTVASWSTLLDAWAEQYRPAKAIAFGLISSRSGERTLHDVEGKLAERSVKATFTGLSAAAYYTHFGSFRRVRLYVSHALDLAARSVLNVTEDSRGRNVAICLDDGQAHIGRTVGADGIPYTSPVLAYLDLRDEPERAVEAAEALRRVLRDMWSAV